MTEQAYFSKAPMIVDRGELSIYLLVAVTIGMAKGA